MPTDTTLQSALRRFGLHIKTHVGAAWTYALPNGEVVHLCWKEGPSISWTLSAEKLLTYRDTFGDFDPSRPGPNAMESFALLRAAQVRNATIRCITVSGSKRSGTSYSPKEELFGTVTMAIAEPGQGIELVFKRQHANA